VVQAVKHSLSSFGEVKAKPSGILRSARKMTESLFFGEKLKNQELIISSLFQVSAALDSAMHPFGQIKSIFNLIDHEAIVVNDEPLS
jgi:hypothetical protein